MIVYYFCLLFGYLKVSLNTMESKKCRNLFFAGEVILRKFIDFSHFSLIAIFTKVRSFRFSMWMELLVDSTFRLEASTHIFLLCIIKIFIFSNLHRICYFVLVTECLDWGLHSWNNHWHIIIKQ